MEGATLHEALQMALSSPIEEVVTHADVIAEQLKTIEELGGFSNGGQDLYDEIKAVSYLTLLSLYYKVFIHPLPY